MSRELGAPLALSLLVHGGAAAAVAVLGAAWLVGSPAVRGAAALYVDLVSPIVATSDRREARAGAARGPRAPGSSSPATGPARPAPAEAPATARVSPVVEAEGPASVPPDVPRPPEGPVGQGPTVARLEANSATEPANQAPALLAPSVTPPLAPADVATRSAGSDADVISPRPSVPVAPAAARGVADDGPPAAESGNAVQRPSRGIGPGELAGSPGPGQPRQSAATERGAGGQRAGVEGARLVRAPAGERGDFAEASVPPEYESYVRSLRQRVQERLAYPWAAVHRGQQGVVELDVRVGADGRLVAVEIVTGASAETLRAAALAAVRGAAPFPFPAGLAPRPLVIRLPVEFRLR